MIGIHEGTREYRWVAWVATIAVPAVAQGWFCSNVGCRRLMSAVSCEGSCMALILGVLELEFHLSGCTSLKQKRGRLAGLRDRFGRLTNVAVCESDHADALQRAQWSFVAAGSDAIVVRRTLDAVERDIVLHIDAVITRRNCEVG